MLTRQIKLPLSKSFFLFGPRQTGKSTLIVNSFKEKTLRTYNLLKSDEYIRLASHPALFREEIENLPSSITHVFVDEIQRVPDLLNEIHLLIESKKAPYFILTGSSARKLKRVQANLLAGRAWTLRLFPLTHQELGNQFSLNKALERGTLPSVYLESDKESAHQHLRSYVDTYLKEEIEAEALVRNSGTFIRFLFQAAHESGNIINYSTIARETATTSVTVKEYYQILEDTLIGFFLFPFHRSQRKRLSQHPKFYLFDTGVQRALTRKLNVPLASATPEYGMAFETWIINETMRLSSYLRKDFQFSYFRTEGGAEVDLVIETPRGKKIAVEIKSSAQPALSTFRAGFKALGEVTKTMFPICVCLAPHARKVEGIEILPWREYFERLADWQ